MILGTGASTKPLTHYSAATYSAATINNTIHLVPGIRNPARYQDKTASMSSSYKEEIQHMFSIQQWGDSSRSNKNKAIGSGIHKTPYVYRVTQNYENTGKINKIL